MRGVDDANSLHGTRCRSATATMGFGSDRRRSSPLNSPDFNRGDHAFGMSLGLGTTRPYCRQQLRQKSIHLIRCRHHGRTCVLGMPGFTGCKVVIWSPKGGGTLVVAAATGPVGSMDWPGSPQVARAARCDGNAGGARQMRAMAKDHYLRFLMNALTHALLMTLSSARDPCPKAYRDIIHIRKQPSGGKLLEAVIPMMKPARA